MALCGALCVVLVSVAPAVQAKAGDLDPAFGTAGKVTTDFAGFNEAALAVVQQSDGRLITVGGAAVGTEGSGNDFALARYNADGTLDPFFGNTGKVTTDFTGGFDEARGGAVLQPDGKVVAAGFVAAPGGFDFGLARYNPDGTLDRTFGVAGKVTTDLAASSHDSAQGLVLQPDGKLVAVGYAGLTFLSDDFALARYNQDGTLDPTFGTAGKVTTDFAGDDDSVHAVILQPDGKLVTAGSAVTGGTSDVALARYNPDGTLDTTFGTAGKVTTDFAGKADLATTVVLQPDGKLLVVGYATLGSLDVALARYNPDGTLDTTFGTAGKVTTDFAGAPDAAYAAVLQPDGKLLTAGSATSQSTDVDVALARYNPDGTLDPNFGNAGKITTDFAGKADLALDAILQSDGKLLTAGQAILDRSFDSALARYDTGLAPDLAVMQTASPLTVRVGDTVTFSITVTNFGSLGVPGATLTDRLPASMTFVSSAGAECTTPAVGSSGRVVCPLDPLPRGATATVTVVARAGAAGTPLNTATVDAEGPVADLRPENNATSVNVFVTDPL